MRDRVYKWWKRQPRTVRKPFVFALGLVLVIAAPLVGWIPGPGGIILFLAGIAVLASEFDWAKHIEIFFLKTVPKEIEKRWQPTPAWEAIFDVTAILLLLAALSAATMDWWAPVLSFGIAAICLFLFNRDRLSRLRRRLSRNR